MSGRYEQLLNGELSIEDLDTEELVRGQLKDKNGFFTGRPPMVIPRAMHQACMREWQERIQAEMRSDLTGALDALREITQNRRAPADARVKAATIILERTLGKVPERTVVQAEVKPWEDGVEGLLMDTDGG